MTRPRILLLGAGGHGKAIADLLLADGGFEIAGFVDSAPKASQVLGLPMLGDESLLAALAGQGIAVDTGKRLRLLPHRHGTDGFFAAVLERA